MRRVRRPEQRGGLVAFVRSISFDREPNFQLRATYYLTEETIGGEVLCGLNGGPYLGESTLGWERVSQ